MITKEVFNQEMNRLALIYEKSVSKELAQITFDKLEGILANDAQLCGLFERLSEEPYFPRLGKMVSTALEMGVHKYGGKSSSGVPIIFECRCGRSFAVQRSDLAEKDVRKPIPCPGVTYETCRRIYELGYLKRLADQNHQNMITIQ